MPDDQKTKAELIAELSSLRNRIAQIEGTAGDEKPSGQEKSEDTFKLVFDNAPDGMLLADVETKKFRMANNALCQKLGYTEQEIPSLGVADIHPLEDLPYVVSQFERQARGEILVASNIPVKRKDGSVFYADISSVETKLFGRPHLMGIFRDVTDRRRTEDSLRQSEEKFRLAMETANDALWDWNIATNEVYRNPRHATMLGYEPHELTASQDEWQTRIHPDDKQWVLRTLEEHLAGKTDHWQGEYRLKTKSGDYVWVLGRGRVVARSGDGTPKRMIGTNIDITERKRTQEALEQSEQRYRDLFENMTSGVAVYEAVDDGADFVFKDLNRAGQAIDQIEREDVVGKLVTEAYPGIKEFGLLEVLRRVFLTGNPELFPAVHYKDGRLSGWRDNRVYKLATGEVVAVYDDTTEQREAEEALGKSQSLIQGILDNASSIIVVRDVRGRYVLVNREVEDLLGMRREEILGKTPYDIHPGDKARKILADDKKSIESRASVQIEDQFDAGGRLRTFFGSRFPLLDPQGEPYAVCTVAADITERKEAEDALGQSERKYRTLINNIPDVIWTSDAEGNSTFISPNVEKIYGYTPKEICEQRHDLWLSQVHPGDVRRVEQAYRGLLDKGTRFDVEYRIRRKDGQWIWLHDRSIATYEKDGVKYADGIFSDVTVRKIVDVTLKESQASLKLAQQMAHIGSWEWNLETGSLGWSDEIYRLLGFEPGQLEPTFDFFLKCVHPQDRDHIRSAFEKSASEGQQYEGEFRVIRADGVERVWDCRGRVLCDSQGEPIRMLATAQDITERRRSERRQALRFEILEALHQQKPLKEVCADTLSLIRAGMGCDAAALRMRDGNDCPRFISDGFSQEFVDADNRICCNNQQNDRTGSPDDASLSGCMCGVILDGRIDTSQPFFTSKGSFWTNNLSSLLASTSPADRGGATCKTCAEHGFGSVALIPIESDGRIIGLLQVNTARGNFFSLSRIQFLEELAILIGVALERKRVENALRESEEKYRAIVECAGESIASVDANGVFLFMNATGAERLGGKPDDYIGKRMWDLFPKEIADRQMASVLSVINTGKGINTVVPTSLQGRMRWYNTTIEPLTSGQSGEIGAVMIIARDIHDIKQAQEELITYREKMARAEQLASLGTLSATVAHELTQPLTVVRLSLDNLLDDLRATSSAPKLTKRLEDSLAEISNVTSIIDRFRSFARKSSETGVARVDLKTIAERITQFLEESARRASISLHLKDMDQLPPVVVNERDFEQLFFALVQNAVQASDGRKQRQLVISGSVKDRCIELRFADDCLGIAPENLSAVFEPFFTTKPPGQGTGLGLCIVEQIASRAGGKVSVESELDKGSTFIVTLPVS